MKTPPASRPQRTKITILVVSALVCAGILVWWLHGRTPGKDEVAAFLNQAAGGGRVEFSIEKLETVSQGGSGLKLTVVTKARTTAPLYTKIDPADYLHQAFRLDPAASVEARRLLSGQSAAGQADFQGAAPFPADPFQAVILRPITPAGATFAYHGVVAAQRDGGAWKLGLVSGGFEGTGPQGEARAAFGGTTYAAGEVGDDARLRGLAADFEAFVGRVAAIRQNLASARIAAIEDRRRAFLAQITPGRVFRGTAVEAGTRRETQLSLEIVGFTPENEVTALLRNDNGWRGARPFKGAWSADEQFEKPVLNLVSAANQSVRNAGLFLESAQVWRFALNVDARGELTEQNRFFQYRFQPISAEQVVALRARLEAEFERAVVATEPGLLYLGTAVSRTSGTSEPILLRFGPRVSGSDLLDATFESTVRAWKRPWRGTIIANAQRSGAAPIRLRTAPDQKIEQAPAGSSLGDPGELNLRLGLEQGVLVGADERFTYRLVLAGAAEQERLEAGRIERVNRLNEVVRHGIVYDGTMREDRGYVFRTRLEFTRIDRATGVITARFRSLNRPNVFREFLGTWEPTGDAMVLNATDLGVWDKNFGFNIPFFVTHEGATLHLVLSGNSITGRIAGEPRWTMDFPADAFLAAPVEGPESASPSNAGGGLPMLPKNEGAYLLSNGSWVSLPANHGRVVSEPAPDATEDEEAAMTMRALKGIAGAEFPEKNSKRKDKDKEMDSYLEFDGKDSRPAARGAAMVLLFVGQQSGGEPAIEVARAQTTVDGRRRIKLAAGTPGTISFGEQRVAAYVRPVGSNSLLLTTTSGIPRGTYIFNAGAGYELTQE